MATFVVHVGHLTARVAECSSAGNHTDHSGAAVPISQGLASCVCRLPLCHRSKAGRDLTLPSLPTPSGLFILPSLPDPSHLPLCPWLPRPQAAPCHYPNLFQAHRCHSHQGSLPWLLSPPACPQDLQGLGDPRKTIEQRRLEFGDQT